MNPSSTPKPLPNKPSAAQARKAAGKAAATTETKTGKKAKALKSTQAPETAQAAKKPAPKKTQVRAMAKKPKLVHDSYSLPKDEDAALGALKRRVVALGHKVKKNSLLRAGLLTLGKLGDAALLETLRALPEPRPAAASTAAPQAAKAKPVKAGKAAKALKAGKAAQPATPGTDATQAP